MNPQSGTDLNLEIIKYLHENKLAIVMKEINGGMAMTVIEKSKIEGFE